MTRNEELFARAQKTIPGGVNSPVRAFRSVGGTPRFFTRGEGAHVWDADGRKYIDYVGSWGPLILGHADPDVVAAVQQAAARGLSFGAPTEGEIELEGCYHGHADSLLVKAGSGALTFGNPSSDGVPADVARETLVLDYNAPHALARAFHEHGRDIACVIVEPVAGNMNLVAPRQDFLEAMRKLCDQHGAVLIFDEVMTGFRVGLGSAQGLYGIKPDLSTFGKIVGGGMPLGAFGGRRDIMGKVAPLGPVYQAGTLSGNPLSVAAGLATLRKIRVPGFHEALAAKTRALVDGLQQAARHRGVTFAAQAVGGMFGLYFAPQAPTTYAEVMTADKEAFNRFFHAMLDQGVYLAPSAFEAGFVSAVHGDADLAATIAAAEAVFADLAK